jgi:hypothetical protein
MLSENIKMKIYKTIILPLVLHECDALSLTLKEEHRLRVFNSRVLRRIFGPKRVEFFRVVTLCGVVVGNQRFIVLCCLHPPH